MVAVATALMPVSARSIDDTLKDPDTLKDHGTPINLWGNIEYLNLGVPLPSGERVIVYDGFSDAPLDTIIVGENPDGSSIPDGWYNTYLDNSLNGMNVRFKHDSVDGLKNVFVLDELGRYSAVYTLDENNFSAVNMFVNEEVTAVPVPKVSYLRVSPNPMNPKGIVEFSLPGEGNVNIGIYDIKGRRIKDLIDRRLSEGSHEIIWDGTSNSGSKVPNGAYFLKISGSFSGVSKISVIK